VPKGPLGYLMCGSSGAAKPLAFTLNALVPVSTANAAIVPAGKNGSIDVFASNDTDLVIDVNAYFGPPVAGGLSLYRVRPRRVLDSRKRAGAQPVSGTLDLDMVNFHPVVSLRAQSVCLNRYRSSRWRSGISDLVAARSSAAAGSHSEGRRRSSHVHLAIVPTANG